MANQSTSKIRISSKSLGSNVLRKILITMSVVATIVFVSKTGSVSSGSELNSMNALRANGGNVISRLQSHVPTFLMPAEVQADNIDESDTREYQTDTDNVVGSTELPSSQTEKGELNAESVADKSADASTEIENATHQTPHASGDGQIVIDGQKATADRENVTDDKDSVTLKVTETSDDDKQESVGEGGDDHEESAEDDKEKDGKVRDEGDETADDNDEMQGRDEKVQDKDGKDPINDGKDTIVSQDRADYGDDTHDDKDAGDKEKEDSGGKAVDDSDKDENDDTAQTTIQGSDYKEMMDVYDIVVESDRDLTFEEAMRVRQSDRWDTLRSPQQKVVKKAYISSRQEEAKGSALKYSVLQSRDDVIGQSPVDPSQTRVVYANPDLGSELSKENGKYAACEQANMYIVVKDKNGDRVTDGSQSWTVDLRGPAILTPEVRYLENGVYQITFTPFTPGQYNLSVMLDFTHFVGQHNCIQHWKEDVDGRKIDFNTYKSLHEEKQQLLLTEAKRIKEEAEQERILAEQQQAARAAKSLQKVSRIRRMLREDEAQDNGVSQSTMTGDDLNGLDAAMLQVPLRPQTKHKLNQSIEVPGSITIAPPDAQENECDSNGVCGIKQCERKKRESGKSGEWVVVDCDSPQSVYEQMACKQGLVEQVQARHDSQRFEKYVNKQTCPDMEPKESYLFKPFDQRSMSQNTAINGRFVSGQWIHYMGDSLDEGMIAYGLTSILNMVAGKPITKEFKVEIEDADAKVVMFRWEKLDFTVSFIKATKQWRIPGFRLFRDLDSIQNLINLDVWPGPSIIHQFYKKVGEEIGKKQPGLFVLNFGLHPIAHDMRPDVYETFLRETVRWWRKGTKATDEVRTDIPMLWRRTTVTHFPANELNLMHRCLLPDRLKVYDSIALRVMEELDVPVLDWKTPGQGRAGAQNDNRHFRDKECTGTRVQGTNMGLLLNMVGSMRNWDMTQRIGYTDTYHKQYKGAESR